MAVGLDIEIKNEYGNYVDKILASIDLSIYKWDIVAAEILCKGRENSSPPWLFDTGLMDGNSLKKAISEEIYFLIFADFKAYPLNAKQTHIQTFADFMASECELVFMCVDTTYVEIYCKNKDILDLIYNNCEGFNCESIAYVSVEQAKVRTLVAF